MDGIQDRNFSITRIVIHPPTVSDWIGYERSKQLANTGLPVDKIANPVLLSYLKSLTDEEFADSCKSPDNLIAKYLESLVDREQERQRLRIDRETQLGIFRRLARDMVNLDITSESKAFIAYLISETNKDLLEEVRRTYSPSERPKIEELAETLAGHAFLDRVGRSESSVGFVNDFVFGTFIGDWLCENPDASPQIPAQYASLAATAYRVRSTPERKLLWNQIKPSFESMDPVERFCAETWLIEDITQDYSGGTFDALEISDTTITETGQLEHCHFTRCRFERVYFNHDKLVSVGFSNCEFFDCEIVAPVAGTGKTWTHECKESGGSVVAVLSQTQSIDDGEPVILADDHDKQVLEQFWPRGRANATLVRAIRTLFLGFPRDQHDTVSATIESLRKRGLVFVESGTARLNRDRMGEIRALLGRDMESNR